MVDILPEIAGIDFDSAWETRIESVIDLESGLKAFFISSPDLVTAKRSAGRPQDLADVAALRKASEGRLPEAEKRNGPPSEREENGCPKL